MILFTVDAGINLKLLYVVYCWSVPVVYMRG
jgi:hypothetical protein